VSLSTLFLAAFLILFGISALGWVSISATFIGVVAFVAGILILVEAYHPLTVYRRPQ
jgi:uncharacterized membrane protein HdeD (DUF308 family)